MVRDENNKLVSTRWTHCAIYFEKLSGRDFGKTTDPAVHEYKIRAYLFHFS